MIIILHQPAHQEKGRSEDDFPSLVCREAKTKMRRAFKVGISFDIKII